MKLGNVEMSWASGCFNTPQRNMNNIHHLLRAMPIKLSVKDGKISSSTVNLMGGRSCMHPRAATFNIFQPSFSSGFSCRPERDPLWCLCTETILPTHMWRSLSHWIWTLCHTISKSWVGVWMTSNNSWRILEPVSFILPLQFIHKIIWVLSA